MDRLSLTSLLPPKGVQGVQHAQLIQKLVFVILTIAAGFAAPTAQARDWWNDEWTYRKEIILNAGEGGVSLDGDLSAFPVLIRLSADSFRFADAKFDGADIRFTNADGSRRLNHFIESYDVNGALAFVWVEAPEIAPGAEEKIYMYFGNAAADEAGQSGLVYDADYALVYNFGAVSGVPLDATANLNHARSSMTVRPGFIGNAAAFDGASFLRAPQSPSLRVAAEGSFTVSTWVKIDERQERGLIYARQSGGDENALLAVGIDGRTPFVELAGQAGDGADAEAPLFQFRADRELDLGAWSHIVLRVEGGEASRMTLYVDGEAVGSGDAALPQLDGDSFFGGLEGARSRVAEPEAGEQAEPAAVEDSVAADAPGVPASYSQLVGMVDEIRVSRVARSAGWIRASWLDQGPEGALVQFGPDEEISEAFFNFDYFVIVVQNLSAEAWGVICILAGMLVIAVVTIFSKTGFVNRVDKTNKRFRKDYAAADAMDEIHGKYGPSGMARIYNTAIQEVARRGGAEGIAGARLDASALVAIRSEVDAALTEHIQQLNRRMVLLTIAISGGPFLGLMGTVLGVMITFAGVAAEGNVNINAIAPGVAAALLTTVTGLTVAIPSMFAYNWLTTRIREIASQTRVFSNVLTARIADTFSA